MKYHPINKQLFIKNRKNFASEMAPNSLAVFNSNDIYPISADSTMPFEQHRDIFYLSGVDQEESVLVIFPDCPKEKHREILFLKETSELIAIWEGEKLTKEKAFETSGVKTVPCSRAGASPTAAPTCACSRSASPGWRACATASP